LLSVLDKIIPVVQGSLFAGLTKVAALGAGASFSHPKKIMINDMIKKANLLLIA
jgi:hypothetical protein